MAIEESRTAQRRLATIVALDVVGYSAMTEADEAGAVAAVASLRADVQAAATTHGGRLFNTAGDGFMLEFPTVSGALAAAEGLATRAGPPVRIGVHLGEVSVAEGGDLLGHGVNVAARIQAMAAPGAILVSEDVRRAVRGEAAARMAPKGRVRLDKMDETMPVFALRLDARARPAPLVRRGRRWPWLALAALVLAVLAGGGVWLWRAQTPAAVGPVRFAILPFDVHSDDPKVRYFAAGLADEIAGVMSDNHQLALSPSETEALRGPSAGAAAARLGADFLLDGSVDSDGRALVVRVRLERARTRATLWSHTYTGWLSDPVALQTQVAFAASDVTRFAVISCEEPAGARLDDENFARMLQAQATIVFEGPAGAMKSRDLLLPVVAQAPDFAFGHALLAAMTSMALRPGGNPRDAEALRAEARAEARRALQIDPRTTQAYLALASATPWREWAERERLLRAGMAAREPDPYTLNQASYVLASMGRYREGLELAERGLQVNPLHPGANYRYTLALLHVGRYDAARAQADATYRRWPKGWTDQARLSLVLTSGSLDDAKALLDQAARHAPPDEAAVLPVWRAFYEARKTPTPETRRAAIRAINAAPDAQLRISDALVMLVQLGDLDSAYALVDSHDEAFLAAGEDQMFFARETAPFRADPRFWPLMVRHGLVRYWTQSGKWPDLCGPGGEIPDCPARAAAAMAAAPPG